MLEARFAMMGAGTLARPTPAAITSIFVTSALLAMQVKHKPFLESKEEAGHWSSPNTMAVIAYVCQLMMLAVGLVSLLWQIDDDVGLVLSMVAVVPLFIPIFLTGIILTTNGSPSTTAVDASSDIDINTTDNPASALNRG
eukprot:COSAG02_NODE_7851_length_2818_cov_1.966900_3_plen_140_part_00